MQAQRWHELADAWAGLRRELAVARRALNVTSGGMMKGAARDGGPEQGGRAVQAAAAACGFRAGWPSARA